MERKSPPPLEVFYCYAHNDRIFCEELNKHLAGLLHSGLITVWYDSDISPGTIWEQQINTHLNTAHIILLLVSPDFLASDYCYSKEMVRALERHHRDEARVIPVLLRPVDWTGTSFSTLQLLPSDARPVTRWSDRDDAFENIAKGIRQVVSELLPQIAASVSMRSKEQPLRATFDEQQQNEQVLIKELPEKGNLGLSLGDDLNWYFLGQEIDEKVKLILYKSNITIWIGTLTFLVSLLFVSLAFLDYEIIPFVILGSMIGIFVIIHGLMHFKDVYIVTNKRIIAPLGTFRLKHRMIVLSKVTQVKLLFGKIILVYERDGKGLLISGIKNPKQAIVVLQKLVHPL
jgi:TIR domain